MIEGMAQGLLGANWGDGHATDASLVSRLPASSNPNPFYSQLVNAPYANNAIISTHVYGCASIPSWSTTFTNFPCPDWHAISWHFLMRYTLYW